MKMIQILAAAMFALASSVATAATIWTPTGSDTHFTELDFGNPGSGLGISTNGGILALFDDSDFGGNALVIGQDGGKVRFASNLNGTWKAEVFDAGENSGGSITLTGNTNFVLGIDWGGGYYGDTNRSKLSSPDTYLIVFDGRDGSGQVKSGSTQAAYLATSSAPPVDPQVIPVPAAVWLFASGLLGLVAVVRRRA